MRIKLVVIVAGTVTAADALARSLDDLGGVQIARYDDPNQALRLVQSIRPALIVLDLPLTRTLSLCVELRAQAGEGQPTPILATARDEGEASELHAAGATIVLSRPLDVATFVAQARHWLQPGRNGHHE